jgi:AcrR family transcriptional regulator
VIKGSTTWYNALTNRLGGNFGLVRSSRSGGLRERKKQETRKALSQAASRLVLERGLENVLLEDIASAANVSPRTFNNYFSSKVEAICAIRMDRAEQIGATLRARPADEPLWDALTAAVLEHHEGADQTLDEQQMRRIRLLGTAPELRGETLRIGAAMQRALAEALADRTGTDVEQDMLPMILAGAVTAASGVAMRCWLDADPPCPLRPLLQRALHDLLSAFAQPGQTGGRG